MPRNPLRRDFAACPRKETCRRFVDQQTGDRVVSFLNAPLEQGE